MKREFVKVSDVLKTATFIVAGITFTLFLNESIDVKKDVKTLEISFEQSKNAKSDEGGELTSTISDGVFTVQSNETTTSERIDCAFVDFCSENGVDDNLKNVCEFIKNGIGDVKSDDVAIDGNIQDGFLNVSLRLNDGAILSINKCFDSMDNTMVAFNIFKSRKLLVSDIMEINTLSTYIHNVQNRLI